MQQSNFIFGSLLVAYIVFITVRGELATYLSLLRGSGSSASGGSAGSNLVSQNPLAGLFGNSPVTGDDSPDIPGILNSPASGAPYSGPIPDSLANGGGSASMIAPEDF